MKVKVEQYAAQVQRYAVDVGSRVGAAEIRTLAQRAANTWQDASLRRSENSMRYRGTVENSRAGVTGNALTVNAQITAANAKLSADLHLLNAKMQGANVKSAARITAAGIAANTTSNNTSHTTGKNHNFDQLHTWTNKNDSHSRMFPHVGFYHTWTYNR
jgi:hypothetical protein